MILLPSTLRRLGELLDVPLMVRPPQPQYPKAAEFYFPKGQRGSLSSSGNAAQLAKWRPGWAIMAKMGGNVAAVDVDPRNRGDVARVRQLLDGLGVRVYAEVETPGPGSGRHFYVAGHPELDSAHNITGWPGVDIQSFGSLLFLPGTQRPKYGGAGYKIIFDNLETLADGGDPDGAEALAGWVAELRGTREVFELSEPWDGKPLDQRQNAYLEATLREMHRELSTMPTGGRNTAVYNKAMACGNFIAGTGLDEDHAIKILLDACNHNGLVNEDGKPAVLASIRSGIGNGKTRPRAVPDSGYHQDRPEDEPDRAQANGDDSPPLNGAEELAAVERTDDGNALRLINAHQDQFRRVADMGKWIVWDGRRWMIDHDAREIRHAARELARQWSQATKADASFRANSLSATGISSCVRLAETDKRTSILAADLDGHLEWINTPSGVVNLRDSTVSDHDPGVLLTRITAYPVDLDALHPRWDKFLNETSNGDQQMIDYLQRLAGLALLGKVREHVLPFFWGKGANGKTVFANVLQGILGDADEDGYAVTAPEGFLVAGREDAHPTEIARLRGARLVTCSEQTSGKRFDEAKIKKMTGGDILAGRFMRQDYFNFYPSHLILVLSNFLPAVREGGPAFWRRVRLIPFLHVVPEEQQIKDLDQLLLAEEGPAIFGWCVRGGVEVIANGLQDPVQVIQATENYKVSEDTVASFNRDHCVLGPSWCCFVSDYRAQYEEHCKDMGIKESDILSAKALTMRLTTEYDVIAGQRWKGSRIYQGIGLQAQQGP